MDRAIDMHNTCIRKVVDDFAGHEIRNEGDSFVIAFHEAEDGVRFALRLQERLTGLDWPQVSCADQHGTLLAYAYITTWSALSSTLQELLEHPLGLAVAAGDVTGTPTSAGQGPRVIAGLRVRVGINTGRSPAQDHKGGHPSTPMPPV
jgi:class 3 adenylate cyclase